MFLNSTPLVRKTILLLQGLFSAAELESLLSTYSSSNPVDIPLWRELYNIGLCYKGILDRLRSLSQESNIYNQAFVGAIRQQLDAYLYQLANVESTLLRSVSSVSSDSSDTNTQSSTQPSFDSSNVWSLRKLFIWAEPLGIKLRALDTVILSTKSVSGPQIISSIASSANSGDSDIEIVANDIIPIVERPLIQFCKEWIYGDLLIQQHSSRFFIKVVDGVDPSNPWEFFSLVPSQYPSTFSEELLKSVFECGVSTRFLRDICHDSEWLMSLRNNIEKSGGIESKYDLILQCQKMRPVLESRIVQLIESHFSLSNYLSTIHKLVYLTHADFAGSLVNSIEDLLSSSSIKRNITQGDKSANVLNFVHSHDLDAALESALRNASLSLPNAPSSHSGGPAQFQSSANLTEFLNLQKHPTVTLSTNYPVLCMGIPPPLKSVLSPVSLVVNSQASARMTLMRRAEYALTRAWASMTWTSRQFTLLRLREYGALLHSGHLLRSDMNSLLQSLLGAVLYDGLVPCWENLKASLTRAGSIADIRSAHSVYMEGVINSLFLPPSLLSSNTTYGASVGTGISLPIVSEASQQQEAQKILILSQSVDKLLDSISDFANEQQIFAANFRYIISRFKKADVDISLWVDDEAEAELQVLINEYVMRVASLGKGYQQMVGRVRSLLDTEVELSASLAILAKAMERYDPEL